MEVRMSRQISVIAMSLIRSGYFAEKQFYHIFTALCNLGVVRILTFL